MSLAILLMLVVASLTLGFISATGYALRTWVGVWRWIAAAPLLYVASAALKIMIEVRADPTAHNLWPFEMLATLAIASVLLGGCYLVRLITRRLAHSPNG